MANGSRRHSDSCHVATLSVITGRAEDYILGRMFASCLRLRNSLAGNARHRIFRLMQDAEFRALKTELKTLPAGSKDPRRGEVTSRLAAVRKTYRTGGLSLRGGAGGVEAYGSLGVRVSLMMFSLSG